LPHPTLSEWLFALRSVGPAFGVEPDNYTLKSPTFKLGGWRMGVEHQRNFESVVVRWIGSPYLMPAPSERWVVCPRGDREKGWLFRVRVQPGELSQFLDELRAAPPDAAAVELVLEERIAKSLRDTPEQRRARIAESSPVPLRASVAATIFVRNHDVAAEVLLRAAGICESCRQPAPFVRRSDGTPYLEVHHRIRLADGGHDTVENAIALCPNCHRREHYAAAPRLPA